MPYYFIKVKTEKALYYLYGHGAYQDLTFLDALDVDGVVCGEVQGTTLRGFMTFHVTK